MRPKKINPENLLNKLANLPFTIFFGLFLLSAIVAVISLRSNNQTMIQLREEVYKADKDGGDVNAALNKLRAYVHGHMNTNLSSGGNAIKPPIQLKYTYERLMAAEKSRTDTVNSRIYTDAQIHCERLHPGSFSGGPRVPCIQQYVSQNGAKPNEIPASLYQFDFVSPTWSPDLAGWSLLATLVFFVAFVISYGANLIVKNKIRSLARDLI